MTDSPDLKPLFPLPNLVLFPKTILPLHVFEPRYRTMTADALAGDQGICVALLKPGWESDYYGSPEVYPVGCVGRIVQHQLLPDGRYNLTLHGEQKVSIEEYLQEAPYRIVRVRPVEDDESWLEGETVARDAAALVRMFRRVHEGHDSSLVLAEIFGAHMGPEAILNTIAMHLNVEPDVKERLLEAESLDARYKSVLHILESATTTQEWIDRVRHLYPRDKRTN